jgi:hypothetical protein
MRKAIWAFAGVLVALLVILLHNGVHKHKMHDGWKTMNFDNRAAMKSKRADRIKHGAIAHHVHSEDGQILWQSTKKKVVDEPKE